MKTLIKIKNLEVGKKGWGHVTEHLPSMYKALVPQNNIIYKMFKETNIRNFKKHLFTPKSQLSKTLVPNISNFL